MFLMPWDKKDIVMCKLLLRQRTMFGGFEHGLVSLRREPPVLSGMNDSFIRYH